MELWSLHLVAVQTMFHRSDWAFNQPGISMNSCHQVCHWIPGETLFTYLLNHGISKLLVWRSKKRTLLYTVKPLSELRFVSFCFSHTSNPQSKLIKLSHCEAEGVLRPTFRPTFSEPRCCLKGSEANLISALINKTGEPHHGIQGKKHIFFIYNPVKKDRLLVAFIFYIGWNLLWVETVLTTLNYRVTGQDQNPRKCWMIPKYLEYRIYSYKLWIHDHTICWYVVHKSQGDTRCVFPL